jgi:hypothetical protein
LSVFFALLDPDPDFESGYGSNDLISYGLLGKGKIKIHALKSYLEG